MAILVTGGAGYIGSHMAWELVDRGHEVVVLDDLSTGTRRLLPDACAFYEGDVGSGLLLDRILSGHEVTDIVHLAASVLVSESVADPLRYYRNNTSSSRVLFEAAVRHGVRSVVFSSTAAVYAEAPGGRPVREDSDLRPQSPYGWSKLMAEQMLRDVSRAHRLRHVILRYFNVVGADPQGRTGPAGPGKGHLLKVVCEAGAGRRDAVTIFGTDFETKDGTGVRDYIHVSDLVAAHIAALEYVAQAPEAGLTLNCGYGHGYSVREVIRAAQELSGTDFQIIHADRRPGDVGEIVADPSRLRAELGWSPRRDDLKLIIHDALRWEQRLLPRVSSAP